MKGSAQSLRILFFAVLALVAVPGSAVSASNSPHFPPPLTGLQKKLGLTVVKSFPTNSPNVTGYVVTNDKGQTGMVFSVGPYLFSGTLFDANGQDVSARFAQQEMAQGNLAAAAKQLGKDKTVINEGVKTAPSIIAFVDPNCIYCHQLWEKTRAWIKDGKLRVHWVMVGILTSTSAGKAATILSAKNRVATLTANETGFDKTNENGGIQPLSSIPKQIKAALDRHEQMMAQLDLNGTPGVVYRDRQGQWHGVSGVPDMQQLAEALGIHQ